MKQSAACPKCTGRRIWVIAPYVAADDTSSEMRVVPDQPPDTPAMFRQINPQGRLDLYVCAACGYSEFWARELDDLEPRPDRGVRMWDNTDPSQGPFR